MQGHQHSGQQPHSQTSRHRGWHRLAGTQPMLCRNSEIRLVDWSLILDVLFLFLYRFFFLSLARVCMCMYREKPEQRPPCFPHKLLQSNGAKDWSFPNKRFKVDNGAIPLMRSLVTSIFLYACESWTLRAELQRKIQAMEMRCYRKILHI